MIISRLSGGLGNQMFQYATGRALSVLHNTEIKLDVSWYEDIRPGTTPRRYQLDIFNITAPLAHKKDIKPFQKESHFEFIRNIKSLFLVFGIGHRKIYREKHYHFDPKLPKLVPPLYLEGYFQSPKYFENISKIIQKEFTLKKGLNGEAKKIAEQIKNRECVSLHVRRADYVSNKSTNQFHGTCTPEYYRKAIETLLEKFNTQDPANSKKLQFFIFSDDTDWVKQNIKIPGSEANIHYVSDLGFTDYEELTLMSHCKHNVIANSSFSWWGAWLNPNPGKIVIAPKRWFANPKINTGDLMPADWIRI